MAVEAGRDILTDGNDRFLATALGELSRAHMRGYYLGFPCDVSDIERAGQHLVDRYSNLQSDLVRNLSPLEMPDVFILGALSLGHRIREQARGIVDNVKWVARDLSRGITPSP